MQKLFNNGKIIVKPNFRYFNRQLCSSHQSNEKLPQLIFRPNFSRWFRIKYKFHILTKNWDPNCTEGSFIFGATQSICHVTDILAAKAASQITEQEAEQKLMQLMTLPSYLKLKEDLKMVPNIEYIRISPDDIRLFVPIEMSLNEKAAEDNDSLQRYCRITVNTLSMKWQTAPLPPSTLLILALDTIFERDFSPNSKPEWNINGFQILKYHILRVN